MKPSILYFFLFNFLAAGAQWNIVGIPNFANRADYIFSAVGLSGEPYVIYRDNNGKATLSKFDGSAWIPVGSPGFSLGGVDCTTMAFDKSGTPYVVYTDRADSNRATVMKFNGNGWVPVGNPGFTSGAASYTSIA